MCFFASIVISAQINSTQTGNWNDGTTWVGGVVPTSSDAVVIKAGHKVDVAQNQTAVASSLTAEGSGAELRIRENARLTVTGAFTITRSENGVKFFGEEGTGKTGTIPMDLYQPIKK